MSQALVRHHGHVRVAVHEVGVADAMGLLAAPTVFDQGAGHLRPHQVHLHRHPQLAQPVDQEAEDGAVAHVAAAPWVGGHQQRAYRRRGLHVHGMLEGDRLAPYHRGVQHEGVAAGLAERLPVPLVERGRADEVEMQGL